MSIGRSTPIFKVHKKKASYYSGHQTKELRYREYVHGSIPFIQITLRTRHPGIEFREVLI